MSGALSRFQDDFMAALFGRGGASAVLAQPALAVYRNTVVKACVEALQSNYPSVRRLVGDAWFDAVAAAHAQQHPPRDARLLLYGDGFADTLADRLVRDGSDLACYLPDVARLDRAWTESHAAADAPAASAAWLAALPPDRLGDLHLAPHPSARWQWFACAPVYSIWQRNRHGSDRDTPPADALAWHGEGALLARPDDAVTWRAVDPAHCAFLDACACGLPLAAAANAALAARADTDIAAVLALLLRAGALTCASDPHTGPGQGQP